MAIRGGRARGFTLLDQLLVILIVGIMGAVLIPQFLDFVRESRLNGATAEIASALRYAGNLAVRHRRPFGFQADAGGRWFKIYDSRYAADAAEHPAEDPPVTAYGVVLHPLEKGWYLEDFDETPEYGAVSLSDVQIVFYPDGHSAASDTALTVSLGSLQRTITVAGATGRVGIQ